jgi:hypothetical protein
MAIEILVPAGGRTLGGATRAVLEALLSKGFQNIDPPDSGVLEVELRNVDDEEHARSVPDEFSPTDIADEIKADKEILRVRIGLRLGCFLLYPGFCVLSRPDDYDAFESDPRARQVIGREALELARAFAARELIVCGDAASDFLGTEATTWEQLRDVLEEEEIPHKRIEIPAPKPPTGG